MPLQRRKSSCRVAGKQTDRFTNTIKQYRHGPWVDGKAVHPDRVGDAPQGHGGDLLEHSLWSEYQTRVWIEKRHPLAKHAIPRLAIASALMHDIGKAGDCQQECPGGKCFFDVYAKNKYDGRGDRVHPEYSAMYVSGDREFNTHCQCKSEGDCVGTGTPLDIQQMLKEMGVGDLQVEMVVVVELHWEFGMINIGDPVHVADRCREYVKKFRTTCHQHGVHPSLELLCTCILVSCADIAAGTGKRLRKEVGNMCSFTGRPVPVEDIYVSKDSWVAYGMDKKAEAYRKIVLDIYVNTR